ncbi:purine-nucleoside phosphorylase [Clostridia bacterium]|nr:purine-nucleoside phosphorylase [Clostridia bacterium]
MPTPHIEAAMGDIAKTVLMPGDPLRAKYIAENYLEDVVQFNQVRNMLGFTGNYKGKRVSVMGSGMGMPSIGIYSYELFEFYGVENIIRIGSCGAYAEDLDIFETVIVRAAYSDSTYAKVQSGYEDQLIFPSQKINGVIAQAASDENIEVKEININSSDVFYVEDGEKLNAKMREMNIKAVEMEAFALFANSNLLGKNAACILTVSDSIAKGEATTAKQRETAFTNMITLGLETAFRL